MLRLASGERWLIDCGRQAPDQLWAKGLTWWDIDGQLVTHVHGDHVYGLEDFALMRHYGGPNMGPSILAGGSRPRMIAHSAVLAETWEFLSPSLRYRTDATGKAVNGTLQDYFASVAPTRVEAPRRERWNHSETFEVEGLRLTARETHHIPEKPSVSLEIWLDEKGERIAWWGGDTTVDRDYLVALEPKTTVFFHDCTFLDQTGYVHGAFSELRQLPLSVRQKTILMHHDDGLEAYVNQALDLGFRILLAGKECQLSTGKLSEVIGE